MKRAAIYTEIVHPLADDFLLDAGLRADYHSAWEWQLNSMLNFAYEPTKQWCWRLGGGRVFRAPKMTELFYQDPGNIGDPTLKPENGWNIESGLDYKTGQQSIELTVFNRYEANRIDWTKSIADDPWRVQNVHRVNVYGVSMSSAVHFSERGDVHLSYLLASQDWHKKMESFFKYSWRTPKQQFTMNVNWQVPWQLRTQVNVQFMEQAHNYSFWLTNVQISRSFAVGDLVLKMNNIFDTSYQFFPFVPMPGRHWLVSLRFHNID